MAETVISGGFASVNDKLPERSGDYLCLCNKWGDFQHQILTFYSQSGHFRKRDNGAIVFFAGLVGRECTTEDMTQYVTHWMTLPEESVNG